MNKNHRREKYNPKCKYRLGKKIKSNKWRTKLKNLTPKFKWRDNCSEIRLFLSNWSSN